MLSLSTYLLRKKMKDSNQYQEIQLELPHMKTGFYIYMNKYSMNLPNIYDHHYQSKESITNDLIETQLSLAI